jgi:hypothetical protein
LKNRILRVIGYIGAPLAVGGVFASQVVAAHASFDYVNTFTPAQTEALAALTAVIPIALAVFAVILGIRVGQRLFKQFAK